MNQITTTIVGSVLLAIIGIGCSQPSNKALLEKGSYAMWQERWSDAAADFTKATLQHPGDWQAQYNLGQCLMEMGEPQLASQSLAIAEALKPSNTEIADLYAKSLFACGQQDKLFSFLYTRAKKQHTTRAWARFAEYAMDLDDPDSASNAIRTAITLSDGTDASPYILGATLAERLGENDKAIHLWQQAWLINPSDENISNALRAHGVIPGPTMTGIVDDSQ
jgi:tetratricopeptide (TPR) repeat protein